MGKTFYADCNIEDLEGENQKYRITLSEKPKNCGLCPCLGHGGYDDRWCCNLTGEILYYDDLTEINEKCSLIEV